MRASRRGLAIIAAAWLLTIPVSGQVEIPRHSEIIEVRVTNIDVVVTDNAGRRVHGLTKEDFEILDGGKPQEITNLSEVFAHEAQTATTETPGAQPAPAAPSPSPSQASMPARHIVIFYDTVSTSPAERKRVSTALADLIGSLRPEDEAMVVTWSRALKMIVPPTNDHAKLTAGLDQAAREISRGSGQMTMFTDLTNSGAAAAERTMEARRQVREATAELRASVRALNGILMRLAGSEGRKALVLVSSAFSFRPGTQGLGPEDQDVVNWLEHIDAPELLKGLTAAANAAGVTIYTLHATGPDSGMSVTDSTPDQSIARMRASGSSVDGLTYLAARTGGLSAANTFGFKRAIEKISEDLSSYYSIGYRTSVARKDNERGVQVRTRNRSYTVRARHTLVERSFETELTDKVIASLLFPTDSNALNISAKVLEAKRVGRVMKIPVDVRIPMDLLAFSSDDSGALAADVTVFIASADANGAFSKVEQFRQRIPVKREQLATVAGKYYKYGMDVDLRSPSVENRLSIAVLDNLSKMSGIVTVDVKPSR